MYLVSSRHRDRRNRSARTSEDRRSRTAKVLLEALEPRQLMSGTLPPIAPVSGWSYSYAYGSAEAVDGDPSTSAMLFRGDFIGYNGFTPTEERISRLTSVNIYPADGAGASLVGDIIQGSVDGSTWDTLGTITTAPADGQYTNYPVNDPSKFYRYVRYYSPSTKTGDYGRLAEVQFLGYTVDWYSPAPTDVTYTAGPDSLTFHWTDNAIGETGYTAYLSTAGDNLAFWDNVVASQTLPVAATSATFANLTPGSYFLRVAPVQGGAAAFGPASTTLAPLTGTPVGTPGSWNNSGATFDKALDGDRTTYFDAPVPQAYVGYDFGSPTAVSRVTYYPRAGQSARMVGGQFRGSDDGVHWTTLATITDAPSYAADTVLDIPNPAAYRYVQYLSPDGGYGNVAELHFYGDRPSSPTGVPAAPTDVAAHAIGSTIKVTWADAADNETSYTVELYDNPTYTGTPVTQTYVGDTTEAYFYDNALGTYYARVRAANPSGSSAWVDAAPVTYSGKPFPPFNLQAAGSGDTLTFTWYDSADDETGYVAQLSTSPAFNAGVVTQTLPANSSRAIFNGLAFGTYYFRVHATNAAGDSDDVYLTATLDSPYPVAQLAGTPIGTAGSFNNSGNDITKAFDDNPDTYFDAPTPQAWVGLDLGSPHRLDEVRFVTRAGFAWRMTDGVFQGSTDGSTWTTLATITSEPNDGRYLNSLPLSGTYRYVRYLSGSEGYGNVAELQFFGTPDTTAPAAPAAPTGVAGFADSNSTSPSSIRVIWTDAADDETGYEAQASTTPDFSADVITNTTGANATGALFTSLLPGTYYIRVRALGAAGTNSAWTPAANPVTLAPTVSSHLLTGTAIGTAGSWNNSGNDLTKAFDNNPSTYFDAPTPQAWVGLDLGSSQQLTEVRFTPRSGFAWRMTGGVFQGSNDGSSWTTLAAITGEPAAGSNSLTLSGTYRYVRYLSGSEGFGNVAELQFYGLAAAANP